MLCYFIYIIWVDVHKLSFYPAWTSAFVQYQKNLMNRFGEKFKNVNFGSKNDLNFFLSGQKNIP